MNKKIKYLADAIVQNGQTNDDCLHRPVFDVNVEMFRKNKMYNDIILGIIDYMILLLNTTFENYNPLKGISGANVGIPLNIVIVSDEGNRIFINPVITKTSATKISVSTNCGSVNLPEPIKKDRYIWIQLEWIDIKGIHREKVFTIEENKRMTLTLQHEIDHNKGILITD
jgi:peptide deformylase